MEPSAYNPCRKKFFENFENENINDLIKRLINKNNNIALLNLHYSNYNFGAILTSFALNKYLTDKGYNAININFKAWDDKIKDISDFDEFRNKNIYLTPQITTQKNLEELNDFFSAFIVGSDQVFNPGFANVSQGEYLLKFVNDSNKKIAFAASFGIPEFNNDIHLKTVFEILLSRFNDISVRENSGVSICKKEFNLTAEHVLDPVFIIDKQIWEYLSSDKKPSTEIIHYLINNKNQDLKQKLSNYQSITYDKKVNVEDWLSYIKNSNFVITNSFHGVCFCIIFNKQFVFVSETNNDARILSLFNLLEIPDKFYVTGDNNVNLDELLKNHIDYQKVNNILIKERQKSIDFLNKALSKQNDEQKNNIRNKKTIRKFKKKLKFTSIVYKILFKLSFGKKRKDLKIKYKLYRNLYKSL